jgi:hypothetical protein
MAKYSKTSRRSRGQRRGSKRTKRRTQRRAQRRTQRGGRWVFGSPIVGQLPN